MKIIKRKLFIVLVAVALALAVATAITIPTVYATSIATKDIDGVVAHNKDYDTYPNMKGYLYGADAFKRNIAFNVLLPKDYNESQKYPLIVYLHGQGAQGTDNNPEIAASFLEAYLKVQDEHPAIIVIPQCPKGYRYDIPRGQKKGPKDASALLKAAIEIGVIERYSVDTDRIYLTGISMGGLGTFNQIDRYPDFYAAALSVCGGTQDWVDNDAIAQRIKHVPIYATHSADDNIVPVEQTRQIVRALQAAGGNITYHEFDGLGHSVWKETYAIDGIFEWMFSQSKKAD